MENFCPIPPAPSQTSIVYRLEGYNPVMTKTP